MQLEKMNYFEARCIGKKKSEQSAFTENELPTVKPDNCGT